MLPRLVRGFNRPGYLVCYTGRNDSLSTGRMSLGSLRRVGIWVGMAGVRAHSVIEAGSPTGMGSTVSLFRLKSLLHTTSPTCNSRQALYHVQLCLFVF